MNFNKTMKELGKQVFDLRQEQGLSLQKLSGISGIKKKKLEKLELGLTEIDIGTIKKIAKFYGEDAKIILDNQ
ncbi:MAG: helix-turn-helix domain-containing protein [Alphaproteobacteria bacterium]